MTLENKSSRRNFLKAGSSAATGLFLLENVLAQVPTGPVAAQVNNSPNVILILADDMGYSGITPFGGIGLETPALDRLASEGVVCTNFHTNAPVCSPTRVSIMTGSYQQRAGLNNIYPENDPSDGLDPAIHPSFAKKLQEAGYRTGIFGKWHLGMDVKFNPVNHGFDEFRGYLKGNVDMISHINTSREVDWWHNTEPADEPGYVTDLINKYAVDFIKDSKGKPFFLYIPHSAIHTPIQGRNDPPIRDTNTYQYDNGASMADEEYQRRYREMVKILDEGLQMVIDELKNQNILDNTLIIFLSDNGAENTAVQKYFGANGFFNGSKSALYEGGIRVPAIFYYPKSMQHRHNDELMLTMDLMPTILEFCGVKNDRKIDGVSLLPALVNGKPIPERDIFWANAGSIAMQRGVWKLVMSRNRTQLFNMMIDPKEQNDLSGTYPEKTEEMKAATDSWWNEVTKGTKLEGSAPIGGRGGPRGG
jgi:arylsulfatase A